MIRSAWTIVWLVWGLAAYLVSFAWVLLVDIMIPDAGMPGGLWNARKVVNIVGWVLLVVCLFVIIHSLLGFEPFRDPRGRIHP